MSLELEKKYNRISCVISRQDFCKNNLDQIQTNFRLLGLDYYLILHDKDFDKFSGEYIRNHYHCVIVSTIRHYGKWWLMHLNDIFDTPFENIQVQQATNLVACIQYLVHENESDTNKFEYLPSDIYSNKSIDTINDILSIDLSNVELSFEYLMSLYDSSCGDRFIFMQTLGLSRYNTYRNTIRDFLELYSPIYTNKKLNQCVSETLSDHNFVK